MFKKSKLLFSCMLICVYSNASQNEPSPLDLVSELSNINSAKSMSMASAFGESISYNTGRLTFSNVDVSIPGIHALPVRISRTYIGDEFYNETEFGDWKLDIPYISTSSTYEFRKKMEVGISKKIVIGPAIIGSSWAGDTPCSGDAIPESVSDYYAPGDIVPDSGGRSFSAQDYFSGMTLHIPDQVHEKILRKDTSGQGKTLSNWKVECDEDNGQEVFIALSPTGIKYTFSSLVIAWFNEMSKPTFGTMDIVDLQMRVTKIEDQHGNWVHYNYVEGLDIDRLVSITSSDGRRIDINYEGETYSDNDIIISIEANGKKWTYEYELLSPYRLKKVILPDDRYWEYSLDEIYEEDGGYWISAENVCNKVEGNFSDNIGTIKSPSNLFATYYTNASMQGRSNVNRLRTLNGSTEPNIDDYLQPKCYLSDSIVKKVISGPGVDNATWSYKYSQNAGAWSDEQATGLTGELPSNINSFDYKYVDIISPNGLIERRYINRDFTSYYDGKTMAVDYMLESEKLIKRVEFTYEAITDVGELFIAYGNDKPLTTRLNQKENITELYYEAAPNDIYTRKMSDFTLYGLPKKVEETFIDTRFTKFDYQTFTDLWLIDKVRSVSISFQSDSGYLAPSSFNFLSANGLVKASKKYGVTLNTYEYSSDGTLLKNNYSGTPHYTKFEDYYRGKARKITLPCSVTNACDTANDSSTNTIIAKLEINDDGTTKSVTDFNGNKINYSYTPAKWLTKIDNNDPQWADTHISYSKVESAGDGISGSGIPIGSLRKTITRGNYKQRIYLDALSRPFFTSTEDKSDSRAINYQRTEYDHENRVTFRSFPSRLASSHIGMETEYDLLGRIKSITRTSDNATTVYEYLTGNKTNIIDPEGNETTMTYLAYGSPSYDKPTLIESPDSDDTAIVYNQLGQISSITQGGITEKRLYDGYQQLCKTYRPETGVTAYGYNTQRQPIWRAEGTDGGHASCASSSVPASHKVIIGYDNLGQLRTENFPDTTPDNTYSYDANGNLASLTSGSDSSAISWSYLYNSLNLIDKETLSIDGKSFTLDWGYNSLGNVDSLTYPSGRPINFAPNALGQPTKASEGSSRVNYASDVQYHPNGQLKQLTYGNGMVRNVALDTTGRIDAITDAKGSAYQLNLDPSYDLNDNIHSVIDWVDRSNDIDNMSYDGLDRLKSADGKWGTGNYTYDGVGNIKTRSISGSSITYHYNTLNRLNKLSGAYAYNYAYDTRGNVTHNGRYGLGFNRANQVTTAKGIPYRYDGHNRRVSKKADEYSIYSQAGQLLYRQKDNGDKTDTLYLGKQLIAEVEHRGTYTPPPPPAPKPSVNLYFSGGGSSGGDCPKGFVCESASAIPSLPPADAYTLSWTTSNADSCIGKVFRNGSLHSTLSGTNNTGIYFENEGAGYGAELTCSSSGGTTTKFAYVGNGDEY
ncbi:hypothetical protein [Shewanella nanhaiensis]|uniref:Teneurin-like YD-shell domain-containing protein n=1 Tax=Shewanella nanhaiensis TaxID=2864872 RepID=A0ABS7E3W9_9GAMM|nr:hypothetical protein [Shewanella nanhaiensis]MBW8184294.1 hypothetical protein [Shewanella nanhaiensis]